MILELRELDQMVELLAREEALLYKHSPACWQSVGAERHVRRFAEEHPEIPVYVLDVLDHRQLALHAATQLGVRHESPQVILLRAGRAVWSASHSAVRANALSEAVAGAA